jgi:hypothetical protein
MSKLELLTDLPVVSISFDTVNEWLYVEWRGYFEEVSALAGCAEILRCLQLKRCTKMLVDSSQVTTSWGKMAEWVGEKHFQELADAGLECMGWVYSAHWQVRESIDHALQHVSRPTVVMFDDVATAYEWLHGYGLRGGSLRPAPPHANPERWV